MTKKRKTLRIRIPPYLPSRNEWRKAIHAAVVSAAESRGVTYKPEDKLELIITLYLDESGLQRHDVDNRLKDVMDALQGRVGGPKAIRRLQQIIPNDHQIYRVLIEKTRPPVQSHGMGLLVIRKYKRIGS